MEALNDTAVFIAVSLYFSMLEGLLLSKIQKFDWVLDYFFKIWSEFGHLTWHPHNAMSFENAFKCLFKSQILEFKKIIDSEDMIFLVKLSLLHVKRQNRADPWTGESGAGRKRFCIEKTSIWCSRGSFFPIFKRIYISGLPEKTISILFEL